MQQKSIFELKRIKRYFADKICGKEKNFGRKVFFAKIWKPNSREIYIIFLYLPMVADRSYSKLVSDHPKSSPQNVLAEALV